MLLFFIAGCSGVLVRIDQWVEGHYTHPTTAEGNLDIIRSFWSYTLNFILSGVAGTIVAIGAGYLLENRDSNILIFIAVMIGAIGKLIFYNLVEWVHRKFDENMSPRTSKATKDTKDFGKRK